MRFSVIIPSYKKRFLSEAIESVLAQTYHDFELIVVDDCSPENLQEVVSQYNDNPQFRYFRNDYNYGAERLADNWNHCLEYCTGDYVICMGDDDRLCPTALQTLRGYAERYPEADVIHLQTDVIDENGEVFEVLEPRREHESVLELMYYRWKGLGRQQFVGDFCYKLESLRRNGGYYNLPLAWGSDDITAYIAARKYGIVNTTEICFEYRKNRFSITSSANTAKKMQALLMQREWYRNFVDAYQPLNDRDAKMLSLVKSELEPRHRFIVNSLIKEDMKHSMLRIFYWLRMKRHFELSTGQILYQSFRALKGRI